jgi:hypothetical protein
MNNFFSEMHLQILGLNDFSLLLERAKSLSF